MTETIQTSAPICDISLPSKVSAKVAVPWFWNAFLPSWVAHAHDKTHGGFVDFLDVNGAVPNGATKSILAQARLLFTFAHLALTSDNPAYHEGARITFDTLTWFQKTNGLYRKAVAENGSVTGKDEEEQARSYDQTFVILGLSTWAKLQGCAASLEKMETLWQAVEIHLIDPQTGMLIDNDLVVDPSAPDAPNPAQNPHMHMYEAALQAYEMGGDPVWLARAQRMRAKGLEYFFDTETGTLAEFIKPDLTSLEGKDGQWREIGHQCEWAWLLYREVALGGDPSVIAIADQMLIFADSYGFCEEGVLQGAAFDAVACDRSWREESFLVWPQTEAIKALAVRSKHPEDTYALHAKRICEVMFRQYFEGRNAYINQVDPTGKPLWDEGLSRMLYHLVMSFTEGARFGLWSMPQNK